MLIICNTLARLALSLLTQRHRIPELIVRLRFLLTCYNGVVPVPPLATLPSQAYVYLPLDIGPFLGRAQASHEFLKARRILGRELKPGQEVERLPKVTAMVQATGYLREVLDASGDML